MLSFTFTIFLWVLMIVIVLSFISGLVMFIVDVIRFAPARNKIQVMSSKLESLMDAATVQDPEPEPESVSDSDSEDASHISLFKKRGDIDVNA